MGQVGTTFTRRYPHESSGANALKRAHKDCPKGTHELVMVSPVRNGGYEAHYRRIVPPDSAADYENAVAAHKAKPSKHPEPDASQFQGPGATASDEAYG